MPLQRQSTILDDMDGNHHKSLEEIVPASSPTHSGSSSWKLLRNIFAASRSFSVGGKMAKEETPGSPECAAKKPGTSSEKNSPALKRRLSIGRQRKFSSSKSPTLSLKTRKTSTANSQENLLHYIVSESDITSLRNILTNEKVDINIMRAPGLSPLHTACILGDLEIVETLVEHGADIKLKTWSGLSPLQITTMFGHFDVAQYLITHGANGKDVQNGFTSDTKLISTMLCIS